MTPRIKRFVVTGIILCGVVFYLFTLFGRTQDMIDDTNSTARAAAGATPAASVWDDGAESGSSQPLLTPGARRTDLDGVETPSSAGPSDAASLDPDAHGTRRLYAIGLHELPGLSQDSPAGTPLELWVTWGPPITKEPRVQSLLGDVILERIVMPVTPEGPIAAILSLPPEDIPDLIFGVRYGELSAIALPRWHLDTSLPNAEKPPEGGFSLD
jgi:ABC-type Fe3+-hydroxamate transport system substrate-binding protein